MIFKIIALVLMAAFYACYFIKMLGQKKKGIRTTQIGSGKTGFVKWVECTMMASTVLVVVVELVSIVLGTTLLPPWVRWLGVGIAAVGVAMFITAVVTMRDSWRAGVSKSEKTELVTSGIFSISRNPAFLGFDLVYLGILLMFFNWVLFTVSVFAVLMFHLQIVNVEEDFLLESFGENYLNYRKKVNRYLGRKAKGKAKAIFISVICVILAIPLIILPITTVIVYESIFGERYETASWLEFSVEDYEGLQMERCDFQSEDVTLAGYKYSKANQEIKGVVVIAHGLGGGGHNTYMPFIDYFTSNGYYVFAYDARGNDNSGGDSVGGLPQGIICLDNALHHVVAIEEYQDLPITLFGHSWGGYSVGNVLNMHPDIKAAVIIAGFNESEDLLEYQGQQMAGAGVHILMPYLKLYERIKFGEEFTAVSALQGFEKTDAGIIIVHIENGVPSENVFMDHAGFSTYETVYRAKEIFEADKVIIVTQEYHLYRALYIAEQLGVDAYGVSSDLNTYAGQSMRDAREVLARCKDWLMCIFKPEPTYLGEAIPVSGNGDLTND